MNKPTDPVLNLIKLLDRPIAFHRCLAEVSGSALSGLLLSQALYWQGRANEEEGGWWYKTREQWRGETMMTRSEQETARRRLRDSGILEEERRGIPAKLWYRVNLELLADKLAGFCQQGGDNPPTGGQNPPNILTETTAETTTEKLKDSPEGKPSGGSPCLPAKFDSGKPCNLIQLPSPASDANASSQPPKKSRTLSPEMQNACRATWEAYSAAYFARYGAEPVRNAKVNRNVIDLVKRLGMKEAPHVAAWFLTHNAGYYVKTGHSMGALLSDAEKLRTEWATGHRMTDTKARQTDRAGTTANYVQEILAERRAKS